MFMNQPLIIKPQIKTTPGTTTVKPVTRQTEKPTRQTEQSHKADHAAAAATRQPEQDKKRNRKVKSASFNLDDKQEILLLNWIDDVCFSTYVKRLIYADMLKHDPVIPNQDKNDDSLHSTALSSTL